MMADLFHAFSGRIKVLRFLGPSFMRHSCACRDEHRKAKPKTETRKVKTRSERKWSPPYKELNPSSKRSTSQNDPDPSGCFRFFRQSATSWTGKERSEAWLSIEPALQDSSSGFVFAYQIRDNQIASKSEGVFHERYRYQKRLLRTSTHFVSGRWSFCFVHQNFDNVHAHVSSQSSLWSDLVDLGVNNPEMAQRASEATVLAWRPLLHIPDP